MNYLRYLTIISLIFFISDTLQANKNSITKGQPSQSSSPQQRVTPSQKLAISIPKSSTNSVRTKADFFTLSSIDQAFTTIILRQNLYDYNLIKAVKKKDLECARYLITHGADVNVRDLSSIFYREGGKTQLSWTPLMYAALRGDLEMIKLLTKSGADVNKNSYRWVEFSIASYYRWTPLTIATYYTNMTPNFIDVIVFLLKSGAKIDFLIAAPKKTFMTYNFNKFMTYNLNKELLDSIKKTSPNITISEIINERYRDRTELMFASYRGDIKTVQRLVNEGVNVNERDTHGWTAYMIAMLEGHSEIADFLNISEAGFTSQDYQVLLDAGMEPWHYRLGTDEPFMNDVL